MNKIKPYTWIVRFDVAPEWVADGFNLTDERALLLLLVTCDMPTAAASSQRASWLRLPPCELHANKAMGRRTTVQEGLWPRL